MLYCTMGERIGKNRKSRNSALMKHKDGIAQPLHLPCIVLENVIPRSNRCLLHETLELFIRAAPLQTAIQCMSWMGWMLATAAYLVGYEVWTSSTAVHPQCLATPKRDIQALRVATASLQAACTGRRSHWRFRKKLRSSGTPPAASCVMTGFSTQLNYVYFPQLVRGDSDVFLPANFRSC